MFEFEDGFNELDQLWKPNLRETSQHRKYRAASLLTEIFANTTADDKVISLVTHLGLISSILDVVGHRSYTMQTGGLIPVVIHKRKTKQRLTIWINQIKHIPIFVQIRQNPLVVHQVIILLLPLD